jgi:hypothetical protein
MREREGRTAPTLVVRTRTVRDAGRTGREDRTDVGGENQDGEGCGA